MQWTDVTAAPKPKLLRQFAALFLVVFVGMAAWRTWQGHFDLRAEVLAALGLAVGALGLWRPMAIRWLFSGWMIAAFPIGWAVSRLMLATLFYLVFTPVAFIFRLMRRDALQLRRQTVSSYWMTKPKAADVKAYFRQS